MSERWLPVVGYEGQYEVSDMGRVRRVTTRGGKVRGSARMLKVDIVQGYERVDLSRIVDGRRQVRHRAIHQLVAEAFIGPRPEGLQVNHKDLNRRNNRADNLEYMTFPENREHATANGAYAGENSSRAKVNVAAVLEIRHLGEPPKVLADRYGISQHRVRAIRRGVGWSNVVAGD